MIKNIPARRSPGPPEGAPRRVMRVTFLNLCRTAIMENIEQKRIIARAIADNIYLQGKAFGVDTCTVTINKNSFVLFCYLRLDGYRRPKKDVKQFSLTRIVNVVKQIVNAELQTGVRLKSHACPRMTYTKKYSTYRGISLEKPQFQGYEERFIRIELEFPPYTKTVNNLDNVGNLLVNYTHGTKKEDKQPFNQLSLF